jgi:hypothetical protein
LKPGHAYAWGGEGKTLAVSAYGGTQMDRGTVAAGGMPYEGDNNNPSTAGKPHCRAMKKDGEQCGSWVVGEEVYCAGHLASVQKLEKKIASCEDEAERLLLEEEKLRKWL